MKENGQIAPRHIGLWRTAGWIPVIMLCLGAGCNRMNLMRKIE